jgi:hypothetical protein
MADERRVAHGLADAGRIVDLRRQQHRPAGIEPARGELIEIGLSSRTQWLFDIPAPRAIATMSVELAVAAACFPVIICLCVMADP